MEKIKRKKLKPKTFDGVKYSSRELAAITISSPIDPLDHVQTIKLQTKDNIEGKIDLTLTPYIKQPISCFSDLRIEMLMCIAPTQSAKTVVAQARVAYAADQDPGPLLYVGPDEETTKKIMEDKIIGMIDQTESLKGRIKKLRDVSKDGIELDSMTIYPAWSNSIASLNSFPKRYVIWDEVRLFKLTIGKESNALKLGEDRMTTYMNMGMAQGLLVSTPSTEGDLLWEKLTMPGVLELWWHVPCLHCGKYQRLDFFTHMKLIDEETRPQCRCKYCMQPFTSQDFKRSWNNLGVYAPDKWEIDDNGKTIEPIPFAKKICFRWDSMVSPFRSFDRIWDEYIETKDKPHDYKNFIQAWCSKFWKEGLTKNSTDSLKIKRADYKIGTVPRGVKVLVAGADTQDDGIYGVVYGFGYSCECWLVDELFIPCDMNTTNAVDLQDSMLVNLVNKLYIGEDGQQWKFVIGAWDSGGHRTKEVYDVTRRVRQLVAIKGRNNQNRSVIFSKQESHYNIRTEEYLNETESVASGEKFHLPSNVSGEFLQQFVNQAKLKDQNAKTGAITWKWLSRGADHLRYASAYAFATLDIPMSGIGSLRARLRDPAFTLNPKRESITRAVMREQEQNPQQASDPFDAHRKASQSRSMANGDWWGNR